MKNAGYEILVWLPSPMGDAILCTPALRAIRQHFKSSKISFFANPVVSEVLSPCRFNDIWLKQHSKNPFAIAKMLRAHNFTHAILFKNSFASALTAFLAKIPSRIGYAREGRGLFLTDKLYPPKLTTGKFKPNSMIDYYLAIPSALGAVTTDRKLELLIDPKDEHRLSAKLPDALNFEGPTVVIVPGGTFGPSKYWPSDRFAQTADWLINNYNATVVISVSSNPAEKQIAKEICDSSKSSLRAQRSNLKHKIINLADKPLSLGELKALFSIADLVISNDTGPRHIAIALRRKIISLFGPNNPAWTDTGYENEIKLTGDVPCAPCDKPICKMSQHLCMQAITVEMVCNAAKKLLESNASKKSSNRKQKFIEISKSFFVDEDFKQAFTKLGLTSIDAVFSFTAGKDPGGSRLPNYRSRLQFEIREPARILFLKRYNKPGKITQIKNWFWHNSHQSMMFYDREPAENLAQAGINTPKIIAYGEQWGVFFEKRSFIITGKIPGAESLERKLPDCFQKHVTTEALKQQRQFIRCFGQFAKKFHVTGYRHRDFYLAHVFYSISNTFYLIDLQRVFRPRLLAERFRIKDIAQLYYSAPGSIFSKTDRLRFYKSYTGKNSLDRRDKVFIRKVVKKVRRIAKHDIRHHRSVPFTN